MKSLSLAAVTTHHKHAWEVAKTIPLEKYDVVVTVSGDGLVYEVLNGFAEHADATRALRIPIVPVPAGSGNALALNLLGLQVSFLSALQVTHRL